jgi:hypothetical protein
MNFHIILNIFYILTYFVLSFSLFIIARKLKMQNLWMAWIPGFDIYYMTKVAGKPGWFAVFILIPIFGSLVICVLWIYIAERLGHRRFWGWLTIVPLLNLAAVLYLAFSESSATASLPQ